MKTQEGYVARTKYKMFIAIYILNNLLCKCKTYKLKSENNSYFSQKNYYTVDMCILLRRHLYNGIV